jgi:hypothetical protein
LLSGLVLALPTARAHRSFAAIYYPEAYTAPWTVSETMHRLPDSELVEHVCEENNKFEEQIGSGAQR